MTLEQDALRAARHAAMIVANTYAGFVEAEDLEQDAVVWLLNHPKRIAHARLEDGSLLFTQLVAEIADPLGRAARREKYHALGWDPRDVQRYNRRSVEAALPVVWDPEYKPTRPEQAGPRAKVDPAFAGNWEATAMDVRRAVDEVCSIEDRRLLFVTYALEAKGRESEYLTRVPRETIPARVHKVVGEIVAHLNGEVSPAGLEEEPHDGPGSRQAVNNAHARVMTSSNYGGS